LVAAHIVDDLTSELIPDNDDGALWGSPLTSFPGDTQPIEAARNLPPRLPRWGMELKRWLSNNYRRLFSMHTQTASFPYQGGCCDLDPQVRDPYGLSALRITHDWMPHDIKSLQFFSRVKRRIADQMGMEEYWEEPCPPPYHLSTHEVGTHRMGLDPTASVVNPFGESHECKGLYVTGGGNSPPYQPITPPKPSRRLRS
jgi:gluconate 2-dehydrogenase alpha chain